MVTVTKILLLQNKFQPTNLSLSRCPLVGLCERGVIDLTGSDVWVDAIRYCWTISYLLELKTST